MTEYVTPNMVNLSLMDRVVGVFSKRRMENRIRNKLAMDYISVLTRNAFKASEDNRMNYNWITSDTDINLVLQSELAKIRSRSRWLCRNNAYAKSAQNTFLNYCVGVGYDLQMNVTKTRLVDGEYVVDDMDAFNDYVEGLFSEWAADVHIAAGESCPDSFQDMQRMMARRIVEDGEVFIHLVRRKAELLQLEIIDPEALDTGKTKAGDNPVILGVEIDKRTWRPVAYWVKSNNPENTGYAFTGDSVRVPGKDMVHAFVRLYPRQMRGLPWFHATSEKLFQIEESNNAHLVRAKISALFGVLFENGNGTFPGFAGATDTENGGSKGFPKDIDGNPITSLSPGMIGSLQANSKPHVIQQTNPDNNFDPFLKAMLIASGAGMEFGMSYQGITRDTSNATFASGRASGQMDRQGYIPIQRFLGTKTCSPVFRAWMDQAVLSGAIFDDTNARIDYYVRPAFWQRHSWLPGGWSWGINPEQEVNAAKSSMGSRITALQDECSNLGLDWKVQLRKAAKAEKYAASLGIKLFVDAGQEEFGDKSITADATAAEVAKEDEEINEVTQ